MADRFLSAVRWLMTMIPLLGSACSTQVGVGETRPDAAVLFDAGRRAADGPKADRVVHAKDARARDAAVPDARSSASDGARDVRAPIDAMSDTSVVIDATPDAPVVDATRDAPAVDATRDAPVVDATRDAPVVDATRDAPAVDATRDAPVVDATRDAPVVDATRDAPVVDATRDAPVVDATRDASVVDATADAASEAGDASGDAGCVLTGGPEVLTAGASDTFLLRGMVLAPDSAFAGEVLVVGNSIACVAVSCSGDAGASGATVIDTHGIDPAGRSSTPTTTSSTTSSTRPTGPPPRSTPTTTSGPRSRATRRW